jgi:ABC-2 type transport system permease protein
LYMAASLAYAMLAMFVELISLWADNIWTLMVMARFFCFFFGGSYVPLAFFPGWLQTLLRFTPFPYLISLPVRTTMGIATSSEIVTGLGFLLLWSLIFRLGAQSLWNKGQYKYTGVGI